MFGSKKKIVNSPASAFGEEFIHTMSDDLNPSLKKPVSAPEVKNDSPFGVPVPQKQVPPAGPSIKFTDKTELPKKTYTETNPLSTPSPFKEKKDEMPALKKPAPIAVSEKKPANPFIAEEKIYADNQSPKKKSGLFPILITVLALLIVSVFAFGGYYLRKITLPKETATPENILPEENIVIDETLNGNEPIIEEEQAPITISPLSEKYSYEKPNYLSLNFETIDPQEIKRLISETAKESAGLKPKTPFEFIITDANNNPIAFPMFATFANITVSPELLLTLNEKFSFYAYDDGGKIRTGFLIESRDGAKTLAEMQKEETKKLIDSLSFLFLDNAYVSKTAIFSSTTYNGVASRYLNLDSENTISIDYGLYEGSLLIATSQNSFRAILDKLIENKSSVEATILPELQP